MAYWYDKKNGGLETLTGIPYDSSKLDCMNCHVKSCDACHETAGGTKSFYTVKAADDQNACLKCHKREMGIMKMDKAAGQEDVHFARKMECKDCHTAREAHGDGIEYNSMKQTGAMEAKCENCHKTVPHTTAHQIHGNKLDCGACHMRHVVSCSNCHMETLVKTGKRAAIPLTGWVFLMNYNGRVTSADMQSFVVKGNKTFLMFAPQNSHSIMKQGRKCEDCHNTDIVKQTREGKVKLTWLENNKVANLKGVIPVVDGVKYGCVYQDYENGKWIPIENPSAPMVHYAGYGKPLSKEQLGKLATPMGSK
jgi:predicted CXXCH cytochrome family protein